MKTAKQNKQGFRALCLTYSFGAKNCITLWKKWAWRTARFHNSACSYCDTAGILECLPIDRIIYSTSCLALPPSWSPNLSLIGLPSLSWLNTLSDYHKYQNFQLHSLWENQDIGEYGRRYHPSTHFLGLTLPWADLTHSQQFPICRIAVTNNQTRITTLIAFIATP